MLRYALPSIPRCRARPYGKAIHTLQPKTLPSAHLHQQAHCCVSSRGQLQPSAAAAVSARHFSSRASSQRPRVPQRTRGRATYLTRAAGTAEPEIQSEFEPVTGTWQYIIADPATKKAAIIDPVLDFDPATQTITTSTADSLLSLIAERGYSIERILETHIHADHLTSASYLRKRLAEIQGQRPTIGVGKRIDQVQKVFSKRYAIPPSEYQDAFQEYFDDDEEFSLGNLTVQALHLPGHTPDHLGYKVGGALFISALTDPGADEGRRQRLCGRLAVSFRYWKRALRLPRRQCSQFVPVWSEAAFIAGCHQDLDWP